MPNCAEIAFEVLDIDSVESDQGSVNCDIYFGHLVAENERPAVGKDNLLEFVEGSKYGDHVLVILILVRCESGFVDARAEMWEDPGLQTVDYGAQVFRIQVYRCQRGRDKVVECIGEPAEQLKTFLYHIKCHQSRHLSLNPTCVVESAPRNEPYITDDRPRLPIPQYWN